MPVDKWHALIGDPTLGDAILDRLVHNAYRMAAEERWTATRATNSFDELLEKVIATRKPIFINGERNSAVLISIEEWNSNQEKLRQRAPSDL